ncbi:hypothetical protein F4Z99_17425 [Candidatus Poribacteria bacterium]|nr:hypothetical protein [Candidatus Poribacteria bacterium]
MQIRRGTGTPWGPVQTCHKITEGVVIVSTAGHGGVWLSEEKVQQLPDHYKSYAGRHWHEEDEDAAQALQYLKLLSLIEEPIELEVTQWDIELGRTSRKDLYGHPLLPRESYKRESMGFSDPGWIGGPIVEAYKRQTGDDRFDEMICSHNLAPRPGGFQLAELCDKARAFMKSFDCGKIVEPATFTLEPFRVLERVEFQITHEGKVYTERVSGRLAQGVINGDERDLELYLWLNKDITKIEHEGKTIWEKGKDYPIPETIPKEKK